MNAFWSHALWFLIGYFLHGFIVYAEVPWRVKLLVAGAVGVGLGLHTSRIERPK